MKEEKKNETANEQLRLALLNIRNLQKQAIDALGNGSFESSRESWDKVRVLRSILVRNSSDQLSELQNTGTKKEITDLLTLANEIIDLGRAYETWQQEFGATASKLIASQDLGDVNIAIDIALPSIWNFDNDVALISHTNSEVIASALIGRGQRHVVDLQQLSLDDARSLFSKSDFSAPPSIIEIGTKTHETDEKVLQALKDALLGLSAELNTLVQFADRLVENHIDQVCWAQKNKRWSLGDQLLEHLEGKEVVVVSPGPSLKNNIELLKKNQSRFVVIAPAQTVSALVKHEIIPDYVVVIDPQDYSDALASLDVSLCQGLIASEVCHKNFTNLPWKHRYFLPTPGMPRLLSHAAQSAWQLEFVGKSVSVQAVAICCQSRARSIVLLGQDLAISDGEYYHRNDAIIQKSNANARRTFEVKGYFGGKVTTRSDYYLYLRELEFINSQYQESLTLFNCTEGGAYIDGWKHIPLSSYLSDNTPTVLGYFDEQAKAQHELLHTLKTEIKRESETLKVIYRDTVKLIKALNGNLSNPAKLKNVQKLEAQLNEKVKEVKWLSLLVHPAYLKLKLNLKQIKTLEDNIKASILYYKAVKDHTQRLLLTLNKKGA